jgi:hypothetical protein
MFCLLLVRRKKEKEEKKINGQGPFVVVVVCFFSLVLNMPYWLCCAGFFVAGRFNYLPDLRVSL